MRPAVEDKEGINAYAIEIRSWRLNGFGTKNKSRQFYIADEQMRFFNALSIV